jgi:soluble lytic murein transglycosylase-like protein
VRALAWMESGYQPDVVSRSGARGVLQVLPSTREYVETVLLGRRAPSTVSGWIQVGVVFLRQLLREFDGNERLALAAWYQGPTGVRRDGVSPRSRAFVADVLALRSRGV